MNFAEIISVPIIVTVVYGALYCYKKVVADEKLIRLIPLIAGVLGVILGVVSFYAAPEIIAADNVVAAILVGGASGLAATGTNQVIKQLLKNRVEKNGEKKDGEDGPE